MFDSAKIKTAQNVAADVAAKKASEAKAQALTYLKETDWYVSRLSEKQTQVPTDILEKRDKARELLDSYFSDPSCDLFIDTSED